MTFFTYNGRSSADYGLHIESKNVFSAPEYDVDMQSIPGRNGDLIVSNHRFSNIKVTYTVFLMRKNVHDLAEMLRSIKLWLYTEPDRYHAITDSYDTGHTRYGVISRALDIEEQLNRVGSFTVTFSCKPFRYSSDGQQVQSFTQFPAVIENITGFESRPYLIIYGSGAITLTLSASGQNHLWSFTGVSDYVECDSDAMNFYKDTVLKNNTVTGDGFPLLYPGTNNLNCTGTVSKIEIIPRWCTL